MTFLFFSGRLKRTINIAAHALACYHTIYILIKLVKHICDPVFYVMLLSRLLIYCKAKTGAGKELRQMTQNKNRSFFYAALVFFGDLHRA